MLRILKCLPIVVLLLSSLTWAGEANFICQNDDQISGATYQGLYFTSWLKYLTLVGSFQVPVPNAGVILQGDFNYKGQSNRAPGDYSYVSEKYVNLGKFKSAPNAATLFSKLKIGEANFDIKSVTMTLPKSGETTTKNSIEFIVLDNQEQYALFSTSWTCKGTP